jgi:hypothetical protein
MVLLAQGNKKNNKRKLEGQKPKISKCGLRGTKSLGEDPPRYPIYGGVEFGVSLVVGKPYGVVEG